MELKGNAVILKRTRLLCIAFLLIATTGIFFSGKCDAASCDAVAEELNARLEPKINATELVDILHSLNTSKNLSLPSKFVSKKEAMKAGWRQGTSLWSVRELQGKCIGGDRFGNYEKKLPNGSHKWREADLDYQGGRRGPKRIVFSKDGLRMITVDHYQTFIEVPGCR